MRFAIALSACAFWFGACAAALADETNVPAAHHEVLTPEEWQAVDDCVDRGLTWLAAPQRADGSFPTFETGQPAVTSLAVMAFLSRGHVPGVGPYGDRLDRAIDFVLAQQREDGLIYGAPTDMPVTMWNQGAHTAHYNHAISGVMIGEAFGMTDEPRMRKLRPAIDKAIAFARSMQRRRDDYTKLTHRR